MSAFALSAFADIVFSQHFIDLTIQQDVEIMGQCFITMSFTL